MAGESFFTHDPNEETRAARAEDDTQLHGTIPADLIPYLEEADRVLGSFGFEFHALGAGSFHCC